MKNNFLILIKYTRDFMAFSGGKMLKLVLYSLVTGFTQGIGILMLIPFLSVIGMEDFTKYNIRSNRIIEFFRHSGLPLNLLTVLGIFIVIIVLVRFVQYRQTILAADIRNCYISNIQAKVFRSVILAEWQFIAGQRSSNLAHVITADLPVISNITFFFLNILTNFVLSAVYIVWAMLISVELTVFSILFAALSVMFLKFCLPHSVKSGTLARDAWAKIYSLLLDHLHGLKTVKSYGAESREYDKFRQTAAEISQTQTDMVKLNSKVKIIYALTSNIMLCLFLYIAISVLAIPLSALFLLIVIFSRLLPNISSLQNDFQRLFTMLPSFAAAEDLLSKAGNYQEDMTHDNLPPLKLAESIKFRKLGFTYPAAKGGFALKDLDFEIPALQTTAIIGESGTGKTTVADLITGILKPDSGEILVDGVSIDNGNRSRWRRSVGYLPQENFLFHDTIRNNLLWGNPGASDAEIIAALKFASAYDFVNGLPDGLDTVVKDRGLRLSGGERQRIALARTLIRNPQVLLLDEATSALDVENESRIYQAVSKLHGKMTIIFITHRPETLKFADKVININEIANRA
ncbi:MAG: ABC transporter ATP-binding protein [Victivallales bacterium]|nr:ABC transporter ATP-binding protein [Victivallales bacterium]